VEFSDKMKSVDPGNLPAVRLYRSCGFQEVGVVGTSVVMVTYL